MGVNPTQIDRQFRVRIEAMTQRHHGELLAHGRERPAADMAFFWSVDDSPDYDSERARRIWPKPSDKWSLIALDCARTQAAALKAVAKAMRDA